MAVAGILHRNVVGRPVATGPPIPGSSTADAAIYCTNRRRLSIRRHPRIRICSLSGRRPLVRRLLLARHVAVGGQEVRFAVVRMVKSRDQW